MFLSFRVGTGDNDFFFKLLFFEEIVLGGLSIPVFFVGTFLSDYFGGVFDGFRSEWTSLFLVIFFDLL